MGNFHIYLLAGLVLLFFGILFLSTAFKDISTKYNFNEQVITEESDEITLATIDVTNNGPITAKIKLKKLIACDGTENIDVRYVSSNIDSHTYYQTPSLELKSKESDTIKILGSKYMYYDKKSNNITNLDLFIYDASEEKYTYGYCNTADKQHALANIKVSITEIENE